MCEYQYKLWIQGHNKHLQFLQFSANDYCGKFYVYIKVTFKSVV
jgi:hypothetical protein